MLGRSNCAHTCPDKRRGYLLPPDTRSLHGNRGINNANALTAANSIHPFQPALAAPIYHLQPIEFSFREINTQVSYFLLLPEGLSTGPVGGEVKVKDRVCSHRQGHKRHSLSHRRHQRPPGSQRFYFMTSDCIKITLSGLQFGTSLACNSEEAPPFLRTENVSAAGRVFSICNYESA